MSDEKKVLEFKKKSKEESVESAEEELSFEDQVKRNLANKERMKKDRAKANEDVKRTYRLKDKKR